MDIELDEMNDTQLNHYIADQSARQALAKARKEEALEEWRSRHGSLAGTRVETSGVTVQLEASSRWDEEQARKVLCDYPELIAEIEVAKLDRARAKKVLDEETYQRCQKMSDSPRTRVILDREELPSK